MSVMIEERFHLEDNVLRDGRNRRVSESQLEELLQTDEFVESNLMKSVNGYLSGPYM
ncbi:hypothetical protein BWQ96_05021 [Gracilariopsis chorda]|uniref:Uncharacterized protein n=1 Tax=Gracilariopsis chorda TaxID=448386 RepID=A0A2V3IT06_9FLOR|nr:hypothetical protein BWQ96_05021 [Gracilariopsis chorda]|eukprot:PXF45255.1 hypothetical protein BWQ96_05021 [Gracilariopsis chorda]